MFRLMVLFNDHIFFTRSWQFIFCEHCQIKICRFRLFHFHDMSKNENGFQLKLLCLSEKYIDVCQLIISSMLLTFFSRKGFMFMQGATLVIFVLVGIRFTRTESNASVLSKRYGNKILSEVLKF